MMGPRLSFVKARVQAFVSTPVYPVVVFLVAYAFLVFNAPLDGVCVLALLMTVISLFSRDLVPLALPLFLIFALAPLAIDDSRVPFLRVAFAILPASAAILARIVYFRKEIRVGPAFYGLAAVTAAVSLGGVGCLAAPEYCALGPLYHVLGLGPGMLILYLFLQTDRGEKTYDVADRLAGAAYAASLFVIFTVLRCFILDPRFLQTDGSFENLLVWNMPWRNTATTYAVMLMPFLFFYARRHHPAHLVTPVLLYLAMVATGSRSALVCGFLALMLGFLYYLHGRPHAGWWIGGALVGIALGALICRDLIAELAERFIRLAVPDEVSDVTQEPRTKLALRAFSDFWRYPVFGTGFGYLGNADCFAPTDTGWQVYWYHSAIPQILGGFGLAGLAGYGYNFFLRLRALWRAPRTAFAGAVGLSYIGLLLYSQIDTGIFNPLPFAALAVILFVMLERETERAGETGRKIF